MPVDVVVSRELKSLQEELTASQRERRSGGSLRSKTSERWPRVSSVISRGMSPEASPTSRDIM
jgi:hypothetical protein